MTEILGLWLPLAVAALVQVSFALGVSMLTLLSGSVLSNKESAHRLRELSFAYIFGSFAATLTGIITIMYCLFQFPYANHDRWWSVLCGITVGAGAVVIMFYYRPGKKTGTQLWLPRRAAEFLCERTKKTTECFEAFILGVASVVLELLFIAAPLIIAANLIINVEFEWQPLTIFSYVFVTILPLVILAICNRRGKKISTFQRWREKNKKFLQISAGTLLIILGLYLFVYKVWGV
ncbi:hypothetical protein FWF74_00460 [Candidatus Saccharibacteria bacterium]|nr:hypothetical protein [Candidatus Saccharibacteria bacterium]MCL1963319.1 hypothetical protein [Candidatus Saccharibacteria bacterium]